MSVSTCIVQSDIEVTIRSEMSRDLKNGMLAVDQLVHVCEKCGSLMKECKSNFGWAKRGVERE